MGVGYTRTAIALHWLIALLILGIFPFGVYMIDLPLSPQKLRLYSYHKWAGMLVLPLAVARMIWRAGHRPPPLPGGMPRWQRFAAHGAHDSLYALAIAVPLSGWLMSSALGFPVVWFGVLPVPNLVARDPALGETLKLVHQLFSYAMLAIVAVHIAGALEHQYVERDGTLARMLPFLDKERS